MEDTIKQTGENTTTDIKKQGGTDAEREGVDVAKSSPEHDIPPAENDNRREGDETLGVP